MQYTEERPPKGPWAQKGAETLFLGLIQGTEVSIGTWRQVERRIRGTLARLGVRGPDLDDGAQDILIRLWTGASSLHLGNPNGFLNWLARCHAAALARTRARDPISFSEYLEFVEDESDPHLQGTLRESHVALLGSLRAELRKFRPTNRRMLIALLRGNSAASVAERTDPVRASQLKASLASANDPEKYQEAQSHLRSFHNRGNVLRTRLRKMLEETGEERTREAIQRFLRKRSGSGAVHRRASRRLCSKSLQGAQ